MEPGGGQSQTGQGVSLDGYSDGQGHSEEGQILVGVDHYLNPSQSSLCQDHNLSRILTPEMFSDAANL